MLLLQKSKIPFMTKYYFKYKFYESNIVTYIYDYPDLRYVIFYKKRTIQAKIWLGKYFLMKLDFVSFKAPLVFQTKKNSCSTYTYRMYTKNLF